MFIFFDVNCSFYNKNEDCGFYSNCSFYNRSERDEVFYFKY